MHYTSVPLFMLPACDVGTANSITDLVRAPQGTLTIFEQSRHVGRGLLSIKCCQALRSGFSAEAPPWPGGHTQVPLPTLSLAIILAEMEERLPQHTPLHLDPTEFSMPYMGSPVVPHCTPASVTLVLSHSGKAATLLCESSFGSG